jgi:uncharacterized delta-60 repeat protein
MLESRLGGVLLVLLSCWIAGLLATPLSVAAPSELDPSFGQDGEFAIQTNAACNPGCPEFVASYAQALAVQPDGKLLIAGQNLDNRASAYPEGPQSALVRVTGNGILDGTFGNGGFAQAPPFEDQRLYVQADGSLVDVGISEATGAVGGAIGIKHYTASGATTGTVQWVSKPVLPHDPSIAVSTPQIDGAGRLVVLGATIVPLAPHGDEPKLMRFLPAATPDETFGSGGVVSLRTPHRTESPPTEPDTFTLGNDGSVFVAASTYPAHGGIEARKAHLIIHHFTTDGSLDRSFGRGGIVALPSSDGYETPVLAATPDGGIMLAVGEDVAGQTQQRRLVVARYTKTGQPDKSFGHEGVIARTWISHDVFPPHVSASPNGIVPSAITFDTRGDAVIAGSKYIYTPNTGIVGNRFVARLTPNGFDCSFGSSGVVFGAVSTSANAVAIDADERIVIVGERRHEFVAARYVGGGKPSASTVHPSTDMAVSRGGTPDSRRR